MDGQGFQRSSVSRGVVVLIPQYLKLATASTKLVCFSFVKLRVFIRHRSLENSPATMQDSLAKKEHQ